jgi:quinol monooxygenase YgiN
VSAECCTETAVEGFTASLALELEDFNVSVKLVEPGYGPTAGRCDARVRRGRDSLARSERNDRPASIPCRPRCHRARSNEIGAGVNCAAGRPAGWPAVNPRVCAKLRVMTVVVIADMFGISGRRGELTTLLERFGSWAGGEPGCRRYIFAAALADPSRFVLVSEWETQEALDAHYRSEAFAGFQLDLDGLLARPSESTVYSAEGSVRPLNTRPMDPRDAD